jgi:hypothetical protein
LMIHHRASGEQRAAVLLGKRIRPRLPRAYRVRAIKP